MITGAVCLVQVSYLSCSCLPAVPVWALFFFRWCLSMTREVAQMCYQPTIYHNHLHGAQVAHNTVWLARKLELAYK